MASNYNTDSIRIFKDDNSKTVENALNDIFYGPGAQGQTEADGYPDATLSNLPFSLADYEITPPEDLGELISIDNNSTTVTADAAIFETEQIEPFYPVGKFLWDASDASNFKLIGKIASVTSDTVVELESPYLGPTIESEICYISSSANNNANFRNNGEFIVLIKTQLGEDADKRIFPNLNPTNVYSLKTPPVLNGEYNVNGELNGTYIQLLRISDKGVKSKPVISPALVPATITRLNGYIQGTSPNTFFRSVEDFPIWVAYKINPFGGSATNFTKNTAYSLEITESLPYYAEIFYNVPKSSASAGYF